MRHRSSRTRRDVVSGEPVAIYDDGGKSLDRYTVVLLDHPERQHGMYTAIGLSERPGHPQGFSQFTSAMLGKHLGRRIRFGDLPENVQKHVAARLRG